MLDNFLHMIVTRKQNSVSHPFSGNQFPVIGRNSRQISLIAILICNNRSTTRHIASKFRVYCAIRDANVKRGNGSGLANRRRVDSSDRMRIGHVDTARNWI